MNDAAIVNINTPHNALGYATGMANMMSMILVCSIIFVSFKGSLAPEVDVVDFNGVAIRLTSGDRATRRASAMES